MRRHGSRSDHSTARAMALAAAALVGLAACEEATPRSDAAEGPGIADHAFDDPEVTRIHSRMVEVMAPENGWERTRYLEFDWAVNRGDGEPLVRAHRWDRWEGRARVEAPTQDGGTYVAIFSTDDPEAGQVWVDGVEVTGEEATRRLQGAYSAHINDSYWLIMPYKWTDPGVSVTWLGEEVEGDTRWEKVELAFDDGVGLTPRNRYRAWVNQESGLMERWEHFRDAEAQPSPSDWTEWISSGPIMLALNRRSGGETRIFFSHVLAAESVPDEAFAPPGN